MSPSNIDDVIRRTALPAGHNLGRGGLSTTTLLLFTAMRKRIFALLAQRGAGDGTAGQLSELLQQWIAFTVFTFMSGRARALWSTINPFSYIASMAYIDSIHLSSDTSYRWLHRYWQDHPRYVHSRSFITEANVVAYNSPDAYNTAGVRGRARRRAAVQKAEQDTKKAGAGDLPVEPRFRPKEAETFWFFRYGTLFRLQHNVKMAAESSVYPWGDDGRSVRTSDITVRVFSLTRAPLIKLLTEARDTYEEKKPSMLSVMVYDPDSSGWRNSSMRHRRPLSSVILDESDKRRLVQDAKEFLATESWYSKRGIAWKRGYMLHGAPGTGKSSTVQALASELDLPVYIMPVGSDSMTDYALTSALRTTPPRAIVVFEDIDVYCAKKRDLKNGSAKRRPPPVRYPGLPPPPPFAGGRGSGSGSTLSLSALLNALDGIESSEGRITIMTTNALETLDPALIRPGRVDLFIEYKKATREQARLLFVEFYCDWQRVAFGPLPENAYEKATTSSRYDEEEEVKSSAEEAKEVGQLAEDWSQTVEDYEFTMATLQGMLLEFKKDPHGARDSMSNWVEAERAKTHEAPSAENVLRSSSSSSGSSSSGGSSKSRKGSKPTSGRRSPDVDPGNEASVSIGTGTPP